jgi:2-oxoisovalerate dehydrogenase E2 component (dihydrolipoyl transacylase)
MARFVFKLPDIGEGIAEAEIAEWRVKVGDTIEEDAPLVDMMTDKATVELTSPVSGRVVSLGGEAGSLVATGSELVVLETEADAPASNDPTPDLSTAAVAAPPGEAPVEAPAVATVAPGSPFKSEAAPAPQAASEPATHEPAKRAPLAAPAVRMRAKELGIELTDVHSAHPTGRIRHSDLDAYLAYSAAPKGGAPAPAAPQGTPREGVEAVRVIGLRRKIAEKMQEAKRRIPHITYVDEIDVTQLEALRQHLNAEHGKARGKLTLLPFLVKALVKVLPRFPQVNARYDDDAGVLNQFAAVHVGIAAQTPGGLVVPVLRHAETHDLWSSAAEIARLASAAKDGKASAKELAGSTITITSLGAMGGLVTTPVINHPEVAIVGVNKMIERPVIRNGQIAVAKMMNLSSSFDHRIVDGWDAAEFVQALKSLLENPAALFID